MFKNTLIIGCGLIGSSILRSSIKNKISKNFYVFEKSKRNHYLKRTNNINNYKYLYREKFKLLSKNIVNCLV